MNKSSRTPRIGFLFFEKANFPVIEPVVRTISAEKRVTSLIVRGFDYKEASGEISPLVIPCDLPQLDIFTLCPEEDFFPGPLSKEGISLVAGSTKDPLRGELQERVKSRPFWRVVLPACERIEIALERFCQSYLPDLIVVPEDIHYAQGRLAVRFFRRKGVRTVVLMAPYYQIIASTPWLGNRIADEYIVMNAVMARRLRKQGVSQNRIHLFRNPYFERAGSQSSSEARHFYFLCQGKPWEKVVLADLISAFRSLPDEQLQIKLHPECRFQPLQLGPLPDNVEFIQSRARMTEFFHRAKCVIAMSSVGLWESLACGIAVLIVDYGTFPPESALAYQNKIPIARNLHELKSELAQITRTLPKLKSGTLIGDPRRGVADIARKLQYWASESDKNSKSC